MASLLEVDKLCFNCTLQDCVEGNKNCKRKLYAKDKREYKESRHKEKMTSFLKRQEPIVVR